MAATAAHGARWGDGRRRYLIAAGTQKYCNPAHELPGVPQELDTIAKAFGCFGYEQQLAVLLRLVSFSG